MTKRMLIDAAHPEETRVVVMDGHRVDEFDLEAANRLPLKGNIYLARVVRVEPSLQAAFVEYGGNRHGFLAFGEIHPDYYQIPVADRQRLIEAQQQEAREEAEAEAREDDRRAQAQAARAAAAAKAGKPEPTEEADPRDVPDDAVLEVPEEIAGEAAPTAEEIAADLAAELEAEQAAREEEQEGEDNLPPAPPPELVGTPDGETEADTEERMRERRPTPRFLRNYKIQEVIRRRQIILIQVVKEERGTKGAALTTYISLAGRFSVLMPNSPRGGGVSRKITSSSDRRRLREVIDELDMPPGMSLIVRTAGAQRPKPEIRRDCEYLLGLWNHIRERTLASTAPALIYEEADLIKRCIRDGYARDMDEILVEGDEAYAQAREFMRMLMPEHARKIQAYRDGIVPLFSRFNAEAQLDAMHEPTVQLRSGGYIVINQTEALVAIDVNSGRSTRERNIEDTALRTNLEAAEEIARQLRLRDLAGLIVVDFIDMDANRHNAMVEKRMKDALRTDRARIQVGRISHFGLLEMSRQRLRPSLAETTFVTCPHCLGRGTVRGLESSALAVLRAVEEECAKRRAAEITVRVNSPAALYLLNKKRDRLADIESRWGVTVLFDPDDSLHGAETRIERSKTPPAPVNERPAALRMDYAAEEEADDLTEETAEETAAADAQEAGMTAEERARRPRRRRRSRGGRRDGAPPERGETPEAEPAEAELEADAPAPAEDGETPAPSEGAEGDERSPRRRGRRGGRRRREGEPPLDAAAETPEVEAEPAPAPAPAYAGPTPADPFGGAPDSLMAAMEAAEAAAEAAMAPRPARPAPAPMAEPESPAAEPVAAESAPEAVAAEAAPGPVAAEAAPGPVVAEAASEPVVAQAAPESVVAEAAAEPVPAQAAPAPTAPEPVIGPAILPKTVEEVAAEAPRRGGWWEAVSQAEPPVLVSREGPVVHVTLNRPARRNAIGGGMGEALDELLGELRGHTTARIVVLRGAGGHFCAGLDLTEVIAGPPEERLSAMQARNRRVGARFEEISSLPQVVIAAVEGAAHAGGLGFACCADITFASADARFAAPEARRGLVPAQILPWLARRMGRPNAARMVLEGGVITAEEATRRGLVHEMAADRAGLDALVAASIAHLLEGAPGALAETKKLLAALGPLSPEGYAEAGAQAFGRTAAGPEAAEGIAAFREKRKPSWAVA